MGLIYAWQLEGSILLPKNPWKTATIFHGPVVGEEPEAVATHSLAVWAQSSPGPPSACHLHLPTQAQTVLETQGAWLNGNGLGSLKNMATGTRKHW